MAERKRMIPEELLKRSFGTVLRQLVYEMDADVETLYADLGLPFRSRYTPVIKALDVAGSLTIKDLAREVGLSHSALSQTISQMGKDGLVSSVQGADGRERLISLTPAARALMPQVIECWAAFNQVRDDIAAEVGVDLQAACEATLDALGERNLQQRAREILDAKRTRRPRKKA